MFDLIDKILGLYLAWLWFQVFLIIFGLLSLFGFIMWVSS